MNYTISFIHELISDRFSHERDKIQLWWETINDEDAELNSYLLATQLTKNSPVFLGNTEPLTVTRTNIDINRTKVAVFLVT